MNPRQRIDQAWERMEDAVDGAKEQLGDKADTELGIFLHKNIGTMFLFDKQVREYEAEIIELARDGRKDEAIMKSQEMKSYILYEMKHNRRYKNRLKDVASKLEGRVDKVESLLSSTVSEKILDRVSDLNETDLEEYEEELDEVMDRGD